MHWQFGPCRIWCGGPGLLSNLLHIYEWGLWRGSYPFIRIKCIGINEKRDLHVTDELVLHISLIYNNYWHLEVVITWRSPNFNLCFYRKRVGFQLIKITEGKARNGKLTENFFVGLHCGIISLFEHWKFGMNMRCFTCRRGFSTLLFASMCHGWRNGSGEEFNGKSLAYL